MSALDKGISLSKTSKFKEALDEFNSVILNQDSSVIEIIESYQYKIKVLKILDNKTQLINCKWIFANYLYENKETEKAFELINNLNQVELEEIWSTESKSRYYEFMINILIEVGEVQKSKRCLIDYLDHLLEKKNYMKGLEVIEKYSVNLMREAEFLKHFVGFYSYQGNEEGLAKKLKEIINLDNTDEVAACFDAMIEFDNKVETNKLLQEIIMKGLQNKIIENKSTSLEKKKFVSKTYEYLLNYPQEYVVFENLMNYAVSQQKKGLLESIQNAIEANKVEFKKSKKNKDHHAHSFSLIEKMKTEEAIDLGTIDLADELFGDQEDEIGSEEKRLRDIVFLRSIGDEEGAVKLEKLIESESPTGTEQKAKIIEFKPVEINLDEYERKFELEIRSILKETVEKSDEGDIATVYLSLVKEKILDDESIDVDTMIPTFHTFGFYKEGIKYIDFILLEFDGELEEAKEINLKFQKALLLKELNKLHNAIDLLEEAISDSPLVDYEELAHLYLLAECYMSLGRKGNALKIFKLINNKMPGYRRVKDRIKTIESNK